MCDIINELSKAMNLSHYDSISYNDWDAPDLNKLLFRMIVHMNPFIFEAAQRRSWGLHLTSLMFSNPPLQMADEIRGSAVHQKGRNRRTKQNRRTGTERAQPAHTLVPSSGGLSDLRVPALIALAAVMPVRRFCIES